MYRIITDFEGANCRVLSVSEDRAEVDVEHRDSIGGYNHFWCFRVDGAAGRTVTFHFPNPIRVGYFGAAVSYDYETWHWQYDRVWHRGQYFTYTFGAHEDSVYFAHDMLYRPTRFAHFAAAHDLTVKPLCVTEAGRTVPYLDIGDGEETILLTARHHACGGSGSYVLEGALEALLCDPYFQRYRIICIPFVDYDGVVMGDQGRNRNCHDHNRDYIEGRVSTYATTAAIRAVAEKTRLRFAFDFHAPRHLGWTNDLLLIPMKHPHMAEDIARFAAFLERETAGEDCLPHHAQDNLKPDERWNEYGYPDSSTFFGRRGAELAFALEVPYFLATDTPFSEARAVNTGRAFTRALKAYSEGK